MSVSFKVSFDKTMLNEGFYSNDKDDPGGETWRGISRVKWPSWLGWSVVDSVKASFNGSVPEMEKKLKADTALALHVEDFYSKHFWTPSACWDVVSQDLADMLFDTAVNMGVGRVIIWLQESMNILNRNQESWPDIDEDGQWGSKSKLVLSKISEKDQDTLARVIGGLRLGYYLAIMRKNPSQEKWARGWINRINFG